MTRLSVFKLSYAAATRWRAAFERARGTQGRTCARFLGLLLAIGLVCGTRWAAAEVQFAHGNAETPISISADRAERIPRGLVDVFVLDGNCRIQQGPLVSQGQRAVVWVQQQFGNPAYRVVAYCEGEVKVLRSTAAGAREGPNPTANRLTDQHWLGHFVANKKPSIEVPAVVMNRDHDSDLLRRAQRTRHANRGSPILPVQFTEEVSPGAPAVGGTRRIRAFPRSNVRVQAETFPGPGGEEWIALVKGGVQIIVEGVGDQGVIDISTDRIVIWTRADQQLDLSGETEQTDDAPLEFYLEGNIEFRQGERVIYASAMYYDVRSNVGVVLNAELLTPLEDFDGRIRVAARELRQLSQDQFLATGARLTTSRLGEPTYWIESGNVFVQDRQLPVVDPLTGQPVFDPVTGQAAVQHQRQLTGSSNFIYVGGVPVFYYPRFTTDLDEGSLYIRRVRVRNDNVFGTQILTDWDAYELLGLSKIEGTDWQVSGDYLSERGPAGGTTFEYERDQFFSIPGPTKGFLDVWGLHDDGVDDLGRDRRGLIPDKDFRGRVFWQHRQYLWNGWQFTGEVGLISDRNFLEQFFEQEWDTQKDQTTGLELKRIFENRALSITADVRVNDFFTQTNWLPRVDHYWLGESLLFDHLTWYEHSSVGYAELGVADAPTDPVDATNFTLRPWEVENEGERIVTRQEIDLPFSIGHVKMVPYALGELGHWGADLAGDDIQRAYGQLGVRASLPMWRANPHCHSKLLNLNGLAHKVVFDAEFAYAEANRDVTEFPLYDPLDDDAIEAFRRRFTTNTFTGFVPAPFDERFYAVRTGLAGWVTSPATEVVDDLTVFRFGARQRWQTKRGTPGAQRIVDYIVFDTHASLFPKEDRDNFGELIGLVDYDLRWHVGDRFTILTDGIFDFFADGQQLVTVGGLINRPDRGNLYLGLRSLQGPINNQVAIASLSYRLSQKWIASFGSAVDLADDGNIGQNLTITRLGESFIVRVGFNADIGKDNIGVKLAIEPRFLRSGRGRPIDGIFVPPAGARGLE